MAIYEQSALGSVLGSVPGAISDAMSAKQQRQMNQQQMMMNMQAMQQSQMQLQQQQKALGMDRGGYGNEALSNYFSGLMMAGGTLATNTEGNMTWTMSSSQAMPTQAEAWAQYQNIVGPANITEADTQYFMGTIWPGLQQTRAGLVVSELQKLEKAGYGSDDIQTILYNNPTLKSDLSILMPFIAQEAPQVSDKFAEYMPQRPVNPLERLAGAAPFIGGAAVAGTGLYQYGQGTDKTLIKKATEKFEGKLTRRGVNPETRTTESLNKAQKKLTEATKRSPRTPKGWNERADRMDDARKTISREKIKINKIIDKARSFKKADIAKNTRWKNWMKKMPKSRLNMPIAAFAPTLLGGAGQMLGGDKVEAIGRGLGGGVQAAYGGAKGMSLAKWLAKKVPGIVARKGAQAGAMAMADSPIPGPMDAIGMLWGLGSGGYEMYNAVQEWRRANQSY